MLGILGRHRLVGVMADAVVAAADEQHGHRRDGGKLHRVVTGAARQMAHRDAVRGDRLRERAAAAPGRRARRRRRRNRRRRPARGGAAQCPRSPRESPRPRRDARASSPERTSIVNSTSCGITLIAPGSTDILPTVPTSPACVSQWRSTNSTISLAAVSASWRAPIGTVPACPASPVTCTLRRVAPAIAVTTPTGKSLVQQHRPLLDVRLDVGDDVLAAAVDARASRRDCRRSR